MESSDQRSQIERQPELIRGGRPLLFERLCLPPVPGRQRSLELPALADSVMRELRNLLNTRLPISASSDDDDPQSTVNYGLPDFSTFSAASPGDRTLLARLMERKIVAFEPRLRHVRVSLDMHPYSRGSLIGTVAGTLLIGSISEPVSFPIALGDAGVVIAGSTDVS